MTLPAPLVLDADALVRRLPMRDAIAALDAALRGAPVPPTPQRLHLEVAAVPDVPDGGDHRGHDAGVPRETADLLVMPAAADGWAGTKIVGVVPGNPARGLPQVTASYTLLGPPGLVPVAIIDGAALTGLRTAAVSGVATRLAARAGARRIVVVGSGVQARWHVIAMAAVFPDAQVSVVARDPAAVDALVAGVRAAGCDVPVVVGDRGSLRGADVVCLCTSSRTPVVALADLAPGVHVNAVGAHRPDRREAAADVVAASRVLVGTREGVLAEKGDLLLAEAEGAWSRDAIVADLHEAASGAVTVRTSDVDRTFFASVGHAYEDLVVARAAVTALAR
jgi:ornithine cyclodeaminase/alanine dehydrogenase-like protein (mu-crystallin family)